jgi:hypothetical protein
MRIDFTSNIGFHPARICDGEELGVNGRKYSMVVVARCTDLGRRSHTTIGASSSGE